MRVDEVPRWCRRHEANDCGSPSKTRERIDTVDSPDVNGWCNCGGTWVSNFIGVLILVSIGVALICAALYGLFGIPSSDKGKKRKQEVINGFRLAGGILLGAALMGCLVFGAATAFGSAEGTGLTPLGRLGASAAALLSLFLITITVQRWAKYFAGWIVSGS